MVVTAPRVDPAMPAEGEALNPSNRQAPHTNSSHGGHRDQECVPGVPIAVARCGTPAARKQASFCRIHQETVFRPHRNGRRLPAAALPHAPGQVRHPRLQPMGSVLGTSSGREKACLHSAVTTGDSVGSSTVSRPPSPWRRRLQVAATRTRSHRPRCSNTWVSTSSAARPGRA
jgi:hypothetical protein